MSHAWRQAPGGDGSVAAVIVTFNRREILRNAIVGLFEQTLPLDNIIVVDNASSDGTREMLADEFPEVTTLPLQDNAGPGAAFAVGMRHARERGHGWAWLFNDDDVADPGALAILMDWCHRLASQQPAMVGCWNRAGSGRVMYNGSLWHGRHRYQPSPEGADAYPVDVLRFSGTLVALDVVPSVGLPRSDYFFMMEEVEYCLRMPRTHRENFVVPIPLVTALHEGSAGGASPPWRGYYQTRNHLAMVLEHRSAKELFWCLTRETKFIIAGLVRKDRKWQRARLRLLGGWHAMIGRSGKTLDPQTGQWIKREPFRRTAL